MKRVLKYLGIAVGGVLLIPLGALLFLTLKSVPVKPPSPERVEATPARVERGRYLFHHAALCANCHSEHVESYGFPVKAGSEGGGQCKGKSQGFESPVCIPNITPSAEAGIGRWTDGELLRAIREGIARDGHPLFGIAMPYKAYHSMGDEDARSLVAYLRTLPPLEQKRPAYPVGFPLNLVNKFFPQPVEGPVQAPARSDAKAYGKYLATIALCTTCHGEDLAGGTSFDGPSGPETAANLTPAPETWLGKATREEFIGRFKAFASLSPSPSQGPLRIIMPWSSLSGLTEEDLGALYDYLRSVPAKSPAAEKR